MKAVVFQTAYLGDVVLTTPLIARLAAWHGPVDVVTRPEAAPLLETSPDVAQVIPFDKRNRQSGVLGLARLAAGLRGAGYDVAYLAQGSLRSALAAWRAGIRHRVAFADTPGRWLATERRPRRGTTEIERLQGLAPPASSAPLRSEPFVALTDEDRMMAHHALETAGIRGSFVALAPGSARFTKRWPHFRDLAVRLATASPIAIIGGAADAGLLGGHRSLEHPCVDLSGRLPIRVSAAVLARAALVVANDSAPMHLAGAVGTPVVALFGPTVPAQGFGPCGPDDIVLGVHSLPCRPCSTHGGPRCPRRHHRCMRDLRVATVEQAVRHALDSHPRNVTTRCD